MRDLFEILRLLPIGKNPKFQQHTWTDSIGFFSENLKIGNIFFP